MRKTNLKILVASLSLLSVSANAQWLLTGSSIRDINKDYRTQYDESVYFEGKQSLLLESKRNSPTGFATVMQTLKLDNEYRGERVMLTVSLRSENLDDWAGAWLRVNKSGEHRLKSMKDKKLEKDLSSIFNHSAYDNMSNRPLKGSNEWKTYQLILDVDKRADSLSYGVLLSGAGKVWMDDVNVHVVDRTVPVTDLSIKKGN